MNRFLRCLPKAATPLVITITIAMGATPVMAAQSAPALPQMGFNNWNSTHCRPAFNEKMIRGIANKFISLGLRDAGYRYVNIDDCWANWKRDKNGRLEANPKRFPSGIKALADYIHSKGLKFGLYSSAGTSTCQPLEENRGFPGGLGHEKQDAATFASWGVDYLKYDNCNNQNVPALKRYTAMAEALRATGRPIFFSVCEWGENKPWLWAGKPPVDAGSWRTTGDISDNYASMLKNFKQNVVLAKYATPGHWNDPDMLEVGNGGMTDVEYRSQFSLWSIMAAPLLIGTDLRTIKPDALKILLNKDVIAVDQDPLGVQGRQVSDTNGIHVIVKPLEGGSEAVAVFNETDTARKVSISASEIDLKKGMNYRFRNLWTHRARTGDGSIKIDLPAHATAMYRISRL
ncbi:glycoside hydrolase family 27 protein [Dyella sp. A6]|uniref:glycoside hydrolase family 27 protein n=1 Tax=Dyella aluminiiresistens TaxID=3069105 RepID=UPI002E773755|nr:glycoside hydrolase family 27 protein [Dyella sp. A6]